ncbi:MAG: hypothetical protein AB7E51_11095 [Pseudodesulfovibrio sp.]|uniref:Uncharacterized protein n=1 Tax=Pseudodesulfovibrio indicus TaxID=1716143 RepID=A0A126QLI3_9BACT|nr:hypothetical protein [Pseudodesulfovibrio indicus]AMK10538.1 hypothetical protein AWY79_05095 [Pseudodesulfovibrio indicus]TDT89060.1 hypothetical protein EDC59_10453 [Pseudodesulfovibrio indicus]
MELDLYFADVLFVFALTAFLDGISSHMRGLLKERCPAVFRYARRFGRRYPALFAESNDFYCFFHKDALYGR